MKNVLHKKVFWILVFLLSVVLAIVFLNENISQILYVLLILILGAWMLVKGLKNAGIPQLVVAVGVPAMPVIVKLLASSPFAEYIAKIYSFILIHFYKITGIKSDFIMGYEESITLSFWLIFIIILSIYSCTDHTAMKVRKGSDEKEFKEKNYAQKSEMFCKVLRQKLEAINRETDWNENLFTPIQAEVEVNIKGRRKKKFEDLLKCLRSVKHKGAVFLVLGEPGAGKSVSLRKLCLELLDESKETKKIPVYLNLKKWNKDWNLDCLPKKKDLIQFIKDTLYEDGDVLTDSFLETYFDKMLEDGRWYFIFDSFDEMPCLMGKQNCQELIDKISELLCQFITGANQSGGIIASRMYKSPSEALGATVVLKLQEFNDIKIKIMLQKYLNNASDVISELFGKRENLVVLCRNPFYLTLLINFIRDKGLTFPENQMELYQNFILKRFEKCSGKLDSENLTTDEIHDAAKRLAVYMQESPICGLECPITALYQMEEDEQYWKKALKVLEYAKICRFGGKDETISFVHRRFQEFFLVENIIERGKDIEYEEYKDIVNNASMRDALVLYCEVIEEEKAKEIAKFCWNIVQQNYTYTKNILEIGSLELVNVLYFMAEAFRNRKDVIADFKTEFEQLIDKILSEDSDFVVLLACTNCMVLFEQEYLQKMVLKVFRLKNRWLNDVIIQNCRIFSQLDSPIETQFTYYFWQMNLKTFLGRYRNIHFSLSLSKNFRYIKIVHFMIFALYSSFATVVMIVGIFMLLHFEQYIMYIETYMQNNSIKNLMLKISQENYFQLEVDLHFWQIFVFYIPTIFFAGLIAGILSKFFNGRLFICGFLALYFGRLFIHINKSLGLIITSVTGIILSSFLLIILIHECLYIFKQKELKKLWNKQNILVTLSSIIIIFLVYRSAFLLKVVLVIFAIIVLVALVMIGIIAIMSCTLFLHDWKWIRKQTKLRTLSRERVDKNVKTLKLTKFRRMYIEELLQQKVQLTGEWPDNVRPKYNDDRLELILAKLDCLTLESYNYLF